MKNLIKNLLIYIFGALLSGLIFYSFSDLNYYSITDEFQEEGQLLTLFIFIITTLYFIVKKKLKFKRNTSTQVVDTDIQYFENFFQKVPKSTNRHLPSYKKISNTRRAFYEIRLREIEARINRDISPNNAIIKEKYDFMKKNFRHIGLPRQLEFMTMIHN